MCFSFRQGQKTFYYMLIHGPFHVNKVFELEDLMSKTPSPDHLPVLPVVISPTPTNCREVLQSLPSSAPLCFIWPSYRL